ncbi:5-(carboxyamino)imidazole ribonucleotide mutase [Tetraselmis virus 1]|uniref:5-(Carboxyamino)imidazole ribonucleotide mutase n=1 Tax=Tetraselmis virus 1 TaxID=2060617 RepID=A0A2P0VNU7_9VIRU|nr:5-(carboxyamino)imidazole ribonucleotide mutase [Tetraselmis virus 1]AUF82577.1 5-(carboxyamino)imidazole ribonucleotide mutase [Tetraselmis virus 1]
MNAIVSRCVFPVGKRSGFVAKSPIQRLANHISVIRNPFRDVSRKHNFAEFTKEINPYHAVDLDELSDEVKIDKHDCEDSFIDVTVILGSLSDIDVAKKVTKILKEFNVSYQIRVASAHRAPKYLESIISDAEERDCKVFIGLAGVAAALPGVMASMTTRPVIGVPCGGSVPYDSLLSIVQMPAGLPVATVGIDRGDNAAILAVQILATFRPDLRDYFSAYRTSMSEKVIADDEQIVKELC